MILKGIKMDAPLKCEIVDGKIVISVGKEVLHFATENHPELLDADFNSYVQVVNEEGWMKEVVSALTEEEEDGSTMISRMLDNAILAALDAGAEHINVLDKED